jgi:SpoIIAA-like
MPVTYQIDTVNGIIRTKCMGDVTLDEVITHFEELARDPDCPDRLDVLLDLSEETSIPKSRELQVVTCEIAQVRSRVQFGTCAIVACRDALYGMLRVFEVFSEKLFREARVFRSLSEAEAWLAAQRDTDRRESRERSRTSGGPT